ncbi:hypothetical protein EPYR_02909 [Erwinia pyrifoliae DSM 12163]|nr:hypothetical protein CPI84_05010 [Erwinia pyrifoliae]MCA8877870.1 hypothetical protein [Erwinia pyrifoliae]CAX56457.1 uncharacterized protein EpC_26780 [Erwinia pyrifoliae Ep1/96]CAY75289.1 hypothetical protein EPYR_02909 [Erwinia pyrifoliae DSM 12163]
MTGANPFTGVPALSICRDENLAQTVISSATFGAANSLLILTPVLIGVSAAMRLEAYLLYRLFDTRVFPADLIPSIARVCAINIRSVAKRALRTVCCLCACT